MRARRAALIAAAALACGALIGCGGDAAGTTGDTAQADTAVTTAATSTPAHTPQRTTPLQPGEAVTASDRSPKAFQRALDAHRPIVVAMLMRGIADEDFVASAINQVKSSSLGSGVAFLVYDINAEQTFGDLPTSMGLTGTPSVVVIGRDGNVVNAWSGVVDEQMIRQALSDARDAQPLG